MFLTWYSAQQFLQETTLFFSLCTPQHDFCLFPCHLIAARWLPQLLELHSQPCFLGIKEEERHREYLYMSSSFNVKQNYFPKPH
jgi:hypothetical protein